MNILVDTNPNEDIHNLFIYILEGHYNWHCPLQRDCACVIPEMDEIFNSNNEQFLFVNDHSSVPGLSLLKKLERAKLLELHNSIDSQEHEQRIQGKMKSKMFLQGTTLCIINI